MWHLNDGRSGMLCSYVAVLRIQEFLKAVFLTGVGKRYPFAKTLNFEEGKVFPFRGGL